MANFIISPYAISFNSIKNALESYINDKSVSEVLDTWKDFYTAGAGQTVLELDAAMGAFYAFHFILGRREAYLPVAQNYSSVLGGAEGLGYNASRGHNVHVKIKINALTTRVLSKWDVIGSFEEYDIVLWEDAIITQGENVELNCVIGNSSSQSISIDTSEIKQFTFTAEATTDDCRLILTDKEVPSSSELKDAVNDNYIMLSNPYGSVDVFYLNNGQYNYGTKDVLYLQYIARNSIQSSQISKDSLLMDYGEVVDFEIITNNVGVQSKQSIKAAAPIYHETNNIVRARKDYSKYLLSTGGLDLIDTNDQDVNPGLIALTYLKSEDASTNTLLSDDEKTTFLEYMMKVCPDGVAQAFIEDPIPVIRDLNITLWQKSGEVISADVDTAIQEILEEYENKLAATLDLEAIENSLETLAGVKIARVDIGTKEYNTNTKYKLYDVIEVENILIGTEYQTWRLINTKVQAKSGTFAPDWSSATVAGQTVYDNNLLWQRNNKYINAIPGRWKAEEEYNLYDDVAVGYDIYPNSTTYTEPSWDSATVVDGNVTFNRVKLYDYLLPDWQTNKQFETDAFVRFSNNSNMLAVYKVKELLSKSGTSVDWTQCKEENDTLLDNAITWRLDYKGYVAANDYGTSDKIAFVKDNKVYIYKCVKTCNADTYYSNTKKKGSEQIPFDGINNIKEWIEVATNETQTIQDGVDESGNPIYKTVQLTEWKEGDIVWYLETDATIDSLIEWKAETELGLFKYIHENNNIFYSIDCSNCRTGTNWFEEIEEWPDTYTDNNIVWEIDTFTIGSTTYRVDGRPWLAGTEYALNDVIVSDNVKSMVYNVIYTNDKMVTTNNIAYTVSKYCALTGTSEPAWSYLDGNGVTQYYNNVEDGNVLWTKTSNTGTGTWTSLTQKCIGDIIVVDAENSIYYTLTSILGTSGLIEPNWAGITNNFVTDNNITWTKLGDDTVLELKWNEYLKLNYSLTIN